MHMRYNHTIVTLLVLNRKYQDFVEAVCSAACESIVMTIVALNVDCQYAARLWASREATSGCPDICCSVCAGAYSILNMRDKHTPC